MQVDIKVVGVDAAIRQMHKIVKSVEKKESIHRHVGNIILNSIEESFERETSPFGKKWQPVKIRTIHSAYGKKTHTKRGKQTKGFLRFSEGKKVLTQTGTLSSSFTVSADATGATVGTNLVYAAVHNFGGVTGRNHASKMPERRFMPVDGAGELERGVRGDILEYLAKKITS